MADILEFDVDLIGVILCHGLCVNAQDADGNTYMHHLFIAAHRLIYDCNQCFPRSFYWEKTLQILKTLLNAKADVRTKNKRGISVSDIAVATGFQRLWEQALVTYGYDSVDIISSDLITGLISTTVDGTMIRGKRDTRDEVWLGFFNIGACVCRSNCCLCFSQEFLKGITKKAG
jgi:hypothetical protein